MISQNGVSVEKNKVESMRNWHTPTTTKSLRGFLGLTGYYRKFVQGYGIIAKPLTGLLKKGNFKWNSQAEQAFQEFKTTMNNTLVLAMPDFSKPSTLKLMLPKQKWEQY